MAYPMGVGMVEGFAANDIDHLTIPLLYWEDLWLKYLRDLTAGISFDAVWLEVVHSIIPSAILEYIAALAPIRVGFLLESLTINPDEFKANPVGTQRRIDNLNQKLPYLTHIIVCDNRDLNKFNIPTMVYTASIPERLIKNPSGTENSALFCGTVYGDRPNWLNSLSDLLIVNPRSAEEDSVFPYKFEQLLNRTYLRSDYSYFFENWFSIRQSVYDIWINHLHRLSGCAMINLPHRTQILSGRVIENMAAGKPVISPLMNNAVDKLFEDGKEILYYSTLPELRSHIKTLQFHADLRFQLAEAARINLLTNHTSEVRVRQILDFTR
jgi:glycosyltransferase involved in cell wall biosynthesis